MKLAYTLLLTGIMHGMDSSVSTKDTLLSAAKDGNLGGVQDALAHGVPVNSRDIIQATPLHWAAYNGDLEMAKILIKQGADKEAQDKNHTTPLHVAACEGQTAMIRCLIDEGGLREAIDYDGNTPLFYAAQYGHGDALNELLSMGANAHAKNRWGNTVLEKCLLSDASKKEIAAKLLRQGVTFEKKDSKLVFRMQQLFGNLVAAIILENTDAAKNLLTTSKINELNDAITFTRDLDLLHALYAAAELQRNSEQNVIGNIKIR